MQQKNNHNRFSNSKAISDTKVVVAMSGGVDSSTVAVMLKLEGYQVIGVTLQLYDQGAMLEKKGACCAGQDIYDAKMIAEKFDFPHYVLDYETIFKQEVIKDFADSYLRGETPIPCIKCNQSVKFRDLFKVAKDLGADALVTGHYVRRIEQDGVAQMLKAVDHTKDQSYFLYSTTQEQLNYLHFPLGTLTKEETRKLAREYGIAIADKPDSQDICFVPNGSYAKVIEKFRPGALDSGKIIHIDGTELGKHNGIINYTIGQRRGLNLGFHEALYVIKLDPLNNIVYVGPESALYSDKFTISSLNLLKAFDNDAIIEANIRLRSTHQEIPATIKLSFKENKADITLHNPERAITKGQAAVIYEGERVIGGGVIC